MEGSFSWQMEAQIVLGKFIGKLLYMEGLWLDQLPVMKGYTLEDKDLTSQQNCGRFIPEVH